MGADNKNIAQIIDRKLFDDLVEENHRLRNKLLQVSSVGISSMFHHHRPDAERFDQAVLKGVAEIMQHLQVRDLSQVYEQGYEMACAPGVLDELGTPNPITKPNSEDRRREQ